MECTQCFGDILEDGAAMCPICGAATEAAPGALALPVMAEAEAPELGEEALAFPRQFEERAVPLPERVLRRAEEILQSAEAELRRAAVLFADIRGFTQLGRELPPEELRQLTAEFCQVGTECVVRRGGFTVEFIGDAVLAVFGAPVAFDRDIESALHAALDLREHAERCLAGLRPPLTFSVGIALGPVRSGLIESPSGKRYDVHGDTVNLASRLQGAAGENEILVCRSCAEAVRRWFELRPTPPLKYYAFSLGVWRERIRKPWFEATRKWPCAWDSISGQSRAN